MIAAKRTQSPIMSNKLSLASPYPTSEFAHICVTSCLPKSIDAALAQLLGSHQSRLNDDDINRVAEAIAKGEPLNYAHDAKPFSYLYFGANFTKAYLACGTVSQKIISNIKHIVDLGCGSGASLAGTVSRLNELGARVETILCVDRSTEQMKLLERCVEPWLKTAYPKVSLSKIIDDAINCIDMINPSNTLVVASFVLSEMSQNDAFTLTSKLRAHLSKENNVLFIIEGADIGRGIQVEGLNGEVSIARYGTLAIKQPLLSGLNFRRLPKFTEPDPLTAIKKYSKAWENNDAKAINNIFSMDATYTILGIKSLKGKNQIEKYWAHNAARQRNVIFNALDIWQENGAATFTWTASFQRIDTNDTRHLEGIMRIEVNEAGEIVSLIEAYHQKREQIDVQK